MPPKKQSKAALNAVLLQACRDGDLVKVTQAVDGGADVNTKSPDNERPLFIAVQGKHKPIVDYLITKGVNLEEKNGPDGITAFYKACGEGLLEIVKTLVDAGANVNEKSIKGYAPLFVGIKNNHKTVVDYLLTKGVNLEEKNGPNGLTALYKACGVNGSLELVRSLVDAGANVNAKSTEGYTPLYIAVQENHKPIVDYFIANGVNLEEKNGISGVTALYKACTDGSLEIVKALVDAGANINMKSTQGLVTPLFIAVQAKHKPVVDYLLTKGVNLEEKNGINGITVLYKACADGSLEIVKALVDAGANVNAKTIQGGYTPLYISVNGNHKPVVDYLLTKGVSIDEKNGPVDNTALHRACDMGFLDITKALVDAGADVSVKSSNGRSALDYAIMFKHSSIIEYLRSLKGSEPLWKGFTQSDISKFDTIFEESQVNNVAVCPICLKYVERSDACMYMTHNCAALGGFYNHELYEKYKSAEGKIVSWCTICGRICVGHNHYKLGLAKDSKPEVIVTHHNPFSTDCRDANGGGGLPEKFARFQRMREIALQLQDYVGQMTEREALNTLVEETWNAPLHKNLRLPKIMAERKWNFPTTEFPPNATPATNTVSANYNNPSAYQQPIVRAPGSNNYAGNMITLDDSEPTIQFKHKQADGSMNTAHGQITVSSLIHYIYNAGEHKGKCFDDTCGGILWPQEIALAFADPALTITDVQNARLDAYKARFNEWHIQGAVGGRQKARKVTRQKARKVTRQKARKTIRRHRR